MDSFVKQELIEPVELLHTNHLSNGSNLVSLIELSSSNDEDTGSNNDDDDTAFTADAKRSRVGASDDGEENSIKKQKLDGCGVVLPHGFLDPLPFVEEAFALLGPEPVSERSVERIQSCKQFWKAGDYEGDTARGGSTSVSAGLDHVRVHPKFLHSNATSHKWALGAFAELLDNSLDEVCNGATYVNINMLENKKNGSKMLLVEDNGGGMNPDKMRQCMSLGYSAKSKLANTIGQYGNGFKTSTMRLGADVIVFSRCQSKDGRSPTQSIGMLSYTFLRTTGKEDIVVPMIDYEKGEKAWDRMVRSSSTDWNRNLETIVQWSPFLSETDLLLQFDLINDQGTRIIIYNLWEDDQGEMELDFGADRHDIQIRGVNRDEKKIQMAKQFPNSRHFLTYQHSLRSYASILYHRLPPGFRMILRGKDIEHHNLVNDMMLKQEVTYKPQPGADGVPKDQHVVAVVTLGFVKDAKDHIDIQGFNVYHKNRLVKPFWRVWNAAGSDGRGAIGVLEANFVEPAHDKQGFERTTVLSRLEARLIQMQKTYWSSNCHKIGYAPRRHKKLVDVSPPKVITPKVRSHTSSRHSMKVTFPRSVPHTNKYQNHKQDGRRTQMSTAEKNDKERKFSESKLPLQKSSPKDGFCTLNTEDSEIEEAGETCNENGRNFSIKKSKEQHHELKHRLKEMEVSLQFERDRCKSLEVELLEWEKKLEEANKEQNALIDIFQEERSRRDDMEEILRKKLKDANATIRELQESLSFDMSNVKLERQTMDQL